MFDHARTARIGLPEAVFCEGKPREALLELLHHFGRNQGHPILFTRLEEDIFRHLPADLQARYDYHALSRTAFGERMPDYPHGQVAVVSAGTADGFVTWEAARTLTYLGIRNTVFEDCGVAGLWRLADHILPKCKNALWNKNHRAFLHEGVMRNRTKTRQTCACARTLPSARPLRR